MLTIITCSIDDRFFNQIEDNIRSTIGAIEYELIKIDNTIEKLSIAEAYNKGALHSKFDNLLFIHEDVTFNTLNWGSTLIKHLNELKNVGIIGTLGSDYITNVPSGWAIRNDENIFVNAVQEYKYNKKKGHPIAINHKKTKEVSTLDGVFLAMKKTTWEQIKFDENLEGFHGYDLSICLRCQEHKYFIPDILITHYSEGKFEYNWYLSNLLIRTNYSGEYFNNQQINLSLEKSTFHEMIFNILSLNDNLYLKIKLVLNYIKYSKKIIGISYCYNVLFRSLISVYLKKFFSKSISN
jgi:hypothetical protein